MYIYIFKFKSIKKNPQIILSIKNCFRNILMQKINEKGYNNPEKQTAWICNLDHYPKMILNQNDTERKR